MPNKAFVFGEATVVISGPGISAQTLNYATGMSEEPTPVILEDGSTVFKRVVLTVDSVWVDEDIVTVRQASGPFDVFVIWTNEDDGRLRSTGLQAASLTRLSHRGALEGGVQTYTLTFEGLSRV